MTELNSNLNIKIVFFQRVGKKSGSLIGRRSTRSDSLSAKKQTAYVLGGHFGRFSATLGVTTVQHIHL